MNLVGDTIQCVTKNEPRGGNECVSCSFSSSFLDRGEHYLSLPFRGKILLPRDNVSKYLLQVLEFLSDRSY